MKTMARLWQTVGIILVVIAASASAGTLGRVTLFTFTSGGQPTGQTSAMIKTGSSITMRCRVEYNATQKEPIVYLRKVFGNVTSHVATDAEFEDDYLVNPDRYTAVDNPSSGPTPGVEIYEWTINDARVGDTANYTCTSGNALNASSALISLNVTAEPTQINFYIDDELLPLSSPSMPNKKTLEIGRSYRLRCVVSGGNPFPTVSIFNSSTVFQPSYNSTATSRQDYDFPGSVNRSTSVAFNWKFERYAIGKPIVCTGGVMNINATSTSFIPVADNVLPQFECPDEFVYDVNQDNFAMSCQLIGQNFTSFYVSWRNMTLRGKKDVEITLPQDGRYSLLVKGPQGSDVWWTMTVTVRGAKGVTDLMQNAYHFVAVSNNGQADHIVNVKTSAYTTPSSSAGHNAIGLTAAVLCVFMTFIFERL